MNYIAKNTYKTQEHIPSGFCLKAVSPYFKEKESWHEFLYRGSSPEDVLQKFVKTMDRMRNSALDWLQSNGRVKMKPLTPDQEQVRLSSVINYSIHSVNLRILKMLKHAYSVAGETFSLMLIS